MQIPLLVQCDTCPSWLLLEDFPLVKPGFQKPDSPRQNTCWECRNRQWHATNRKKHPRPRKRVDPELFRFCHGCQRWKASDLFSWPMRLSKTEELTCLKCEKHASDSRYYIENREVLIQKSLAYVQSHWDKVYKRQRLWREKDIERIRDVDHQRLIKNLESSLARLQEWTNKNPDRRRVSIKRLQAKRRGAKGHYTFEQLQARIAYYGWRCWICRAPYEAIDHVKPIKAGGSNWSSNLRPICTKCNSLKSFLWPIPQRILDRRYQLPN